MPLLDLALLGVAPLSSSITMTAGEGGAAAALPDGRTTRPTKGRLMGALVDLLSRTMQSSSSSSSLASEMVIALLGLSAPLPARLFLWAGNIVTSSGLSVVRSIVAGREAVRL